MMLKFGNFTPYQEKVGNLSFLLPLYIIKMKILLRYPTYVYHGLFGQVLNSYEKSWALLVFLVLIITFSSHI